MQRKSGNAQSLNPSRQRMNKTAHFIHGYHADQQCQTAHVQRAEQFDFRKILQLLLNGQMINAQQFIR